MNILGHNYTIKRNGAQDDMGAIGRHHGRLQEIQIASDVHSQQAESTLLHEVLEAISWLLGLKLDHEVIMALESGLWSVLTTNGVDLSPLWDEEEEKGDD